MARPDPAWTPAPRDGVDASRVGVGAGRFANVADFLVARFPAVDDWPRRLACGDVFDASGRRLAADSPCAPGMLLWYWRSPPPEPRIPFEIDILYQDEHLVVVDKPHFLPVTPGGRYLQETALVRLKRRLGIDTLAPMHRLDRDTAGVLVFTVQPQARHAYQSLLQQRKVDKVYEAVARWRADLSLPLVCRSRLEQRPGPAFLQMQVVDGEPNAETGIELIGLVDPAERPTAAQAQGPLALYRLRPRTGRKHQLRAQLSALGLHIVGDRIYPDLLPQPAPEATPDYSQPLQLLARELSFTDPISGRQHHFSSRRRLLHARDV